MINLLKKKINIKFNLLNSNFGNSEFKLLDVGAGNHSASRTVRLFPNCEYHGLDIEKGYSNNDDDFKIMKEFYELDLTKLEYSSIPDNYFDIILITHVIEHLHNGDEVLNLLIPKLKDNGLLYVEYPGLKSTKLPSMYGTLNFYDDPTHVRLYTIQELKYLFKKNDCVVLKSGTRGNYYYIIALPLRIIINLIKRKRINANIFWDLLGFAEFLLVKKGNCRQQRFGNSGA